MGTLTCKIRQRVQKLPGRKSRCFAQKQRKLEISKIRVFCPVDSFNQRARDSSSLERTKKLRRFVRVFAVFSFPKSLHTTGADIENAIVHCYNKIVVLLPKNQDAKRLRLANIQEERMVTGAIKNKVDKIWTDIWAGGITNPLTVIEQLTYLMFIRSLDEKELATEDFENMAGEKMEHIFPASAAGQSMRWSRFKDKDSREIFLTMQQRVFPAIKKMKYGRLPDFDANGELVEIEDDPTRPDEGNTAFARYMDDAMFLIPTPQVLQKIITGSESWVPPLWALPVLPSPRWFPSF